MTTMTAAELRAEIDASVERDELEHQREGSVERYQLDPLLWIDECVWVASKFDEGGNRVRIKQVKMRLYPDQREVLGAWIDLERLARTGEVEFGNVLLEKSRQVGGTWGLAAIVRWLLSYTSTRGLFMHTRAAEVADRGLTIDSFFGRVRYIDARLPAAVSAPAPLIFRPFSTDPASIESPSAATVRGECQRDDPGRGSTFDWAIVDEAAHVQHGESVHKAIDDAAESGKLYLSTPEGEDNFHARLCNERPEGWEYLRLHWSNHPVYGRGTHVAAAIDPETREVRIHGEKGCKACAATRKGVLWNARKPVSHRYPGKLTSPWYDRAVIGKTNEQVAAELDIDRAGALGSRVYGEFAEVLHVQLDGIAYDPDLQLELAWDFGLDATSVPVLQCTSGEVRVIGLFEAGDLFASLGTPDAVCSGLRAYLTSLGVPYEVAYEPGSEGIKCIGDRAGRARSTQTGVSDIAAYRSRGFEIQTPPDHLVRVVETSVTSVKLLLAGTPKLLRVCGVNARAFTHHAKHNVWPMDVQGNRRMGSTTPLDNVHNHSMRAFAYWAVTTHPPQGTGEAVMSVPEGQAQAPRFLQPQAITMPGANATRLRPQLRG